jgi:hypothetical protein
VSLAGSTGTLVGAAANGGLGSGGLGGPFCHQEQPWLLQLKGLGTYIVPRLDVQLSATFLSLPGPQLGATIAIPNATVRPSLGRDLSGALANITVPIVSPGSLYGDRLNQVDARVGKIFRLGARRATVSLDMFNLFNGVTVLTEQPSYSLTNASLWRSPQLVQQARLMKFTLVLNF